MQEPLAILLYQKLAPGSQLVQRLQALRYRVRVVSAPHELQPVAEQEKPMIILADLVDGDPGVPGAVARLRQASATSHIPVIVFTANPQTCGLAAGQPGSPSAVVSDAAVLNHLPQLLERALTEF